MSFIDAFLNVLAIIGIIIAGGFVVFFLGDLLLSILEPRHKTVYKEKEEKNDYVQQNYCKPENNQKFVMEEEPVSQISEEKFVMDDEEVKPVDYDEAQKEEKSLNLDNFEDYKSPVAVAESKEKSPRSTDDLNNLFNDDDFNFGEDFDFDNLFEDEKAKNEIISTNEQNIVAETENLQPIKEIVSENVDNKENLEYLVNLRETEKALLLEIENLKKELEEQRKLYEELKAQSKNNEQKWETEKVELEKLYAHHEVVEEEKSTPLLTLEEYENRLEVLKARLKANEKELKLNKKEFLPLKRVRKNLDSDKSKLRRREALVAKQKVMLYGVNNIMEIDPEKAKKLAEDLDLLDGLKVSVKHCEEVMENNKERYPILETTNRILITANQDLKNDIAECETAITKLKNQNGIGDGSEELLANVSVALNGSQNTSDVLVTVNGEEVVPAKRGRGRPRKQPVEENTVQENKVAENSNVGVVEENLKVEVVEANKTESEVSDNLFEDFNTEDNQFFEDLVGKEDNIKNKPNADEE
ncbi:MAG: hypothetical protein PHQ62_03725 [Clostridia bacterium]|nr:hypothetical protein [Clostridia bacterium]